MLDFKKYRWFITSSGKIIVGGKSSEQNEELMKKIKKEDILMHTSAPGSPFTIIKKPNSQDLEEMAVFTACFSQDWKRGKKKSEIHIFKGSQIFKKKNMKPGTFGVLGKIQKKKVELKLALTIQKNTLRAVPLKTTKNQLLILTPGKFQKKDAALQIQNKLTKKGIERSLEEIMQGIPAGKIGIKD